MKYFNMLPCILLVLGILAFKPSLAQHKNLDPGGDFKGVKLGVPVNLYITQGSPRKVTMEGPGDVADRIRTRIHEDMLYIVKKDNDSGWWEKWKKKGQSVKIYVTAPDIGHLAVSSGGNIRSENKLRSKRLYVSASGSGSVKVVAEADELEAKATGSGIVGLRGSARNTKFRVSGSGNLDAERLVAHNCQVEISGSGNCRIQVNNDLLSRISGSGQVHYRGNPKRIVNNASGSGALKKI